MVSILKGEEFHQIGMVTFGDFPLASQTSLGKLAVTRSNITISMFLGRLILFGGKGKYTFDKTEAKSISTYNWTRPGIRIFHSKGGYPPFIVFFSFRIAYLEAGLKRLGYKIE